MSVGVVRPETNAPHGVKRTGFGEKRATSSVQTMAFHPQICKKNGKIPCENGGFASTLPNGAIESTNAAADAFVRLGI